MQREIQIICGTVQIPNLSDFLKVISSIASENEVVIQGLNADLIAGERHLHFAVGKAVRAVAAGRNIAKDPGIEIMRYAACLLYTSPSPRDRQKSRMPSSA